MAEDVFHGPLVNAGSLISGRITPTDGPNIQYQGDAFPDPRFSPLAKDGVAPGRVQAFGAQQWIVAVDTIPSANTTANVAAAQAPSTTGGIALNLTTAVLGTAAGVPVWTPGVPIIPTNTTVPVTVSAIDFGFATGTTAANSSTVIVDDITKFDQGQWIVIGGAGSGSATNVALITQVQSLSTNANSALIFISPVAATALSHAPIGQGNLYSQLLPPATQFGPSAASANAAEPFVLAGLAKLYDPLQMSARALCVQAASIGSGTGSFLVTGYDVYGVPMTELIVANGTNVVNGKKAFKYVLNIKTVTAATTVTPANVQIGVSDVFGLPLRSDKWEYTEIYWNGCVAQTNAGWTAALTTTSSTTTIDVRGSVNASTLAVATVASTNGGRRLTIVQALPILNMLNATPLSTSSMFGTTQV